MLMETGNYFVPKSNSQVLRVSWWCDREICSSGVQLTFDLLTLEDESTLVPIEHQ